MKRLRYTMEDEPLPGSDRERERYGTIPTLAGELVGEGILTDRKMWPFRSWAVDAGFKYPEAALPFLSQCDSAAEAYFARGFFTPGFTIVDGLPTRPDGTTMRLQVRRGFLRMDAVVERGPVRLAVEVDGLSFHARKYDQVAADYLRERRLIACGYVLVRFTAQEVFADAAACWAQLDSILIAHTR